MQIANPFNNYGYRAHQNDWPIDLQYGLYREIDDDVLFLRTFVRFLVVRTNADFIALNLRLLLSLSLSLSYMLCLCARWVSIDASVVD